MVRLEMFDRNVVRKIAKKEMVGADHIGEGLEKDTIIIIPNRERDLYVGIGDGLTTKVNANIGFSNKWRNLPEFLDMADIAKKAGADTIMDLSTIGYRNDLDFTTTRKEMMDRTGLPLGTVPLYEAGRIAEKYYGKKAWDVDRNLFLRTVENQAKEGVKFMAIHCGMNRKSMEAFYRGDRPIVSKGGAMVARYMSKTGKENPAFEYFDELLEILKEYSVVLNVGSGLRSGSTRDNDEAQLAELKICAGLANQATKYGVQVGIEGPGHLLYNDIGPLVKTVKKINNGKPFFTLGPTVTDVFKGCDDYIAVAGAVEAVRQGVSWLCYITSAEHLRMPDKNDVYRGVMSARVAAHIGDQANGQPRAVYEESLNRPRCGKEEPGRSCNMCGDYCSLFFP